MKKIIIDCETIPDERPNVREYFSDVSPPAQMKKAETIAAWERDDKPAAIDAQIRKLAVNPWFAQMVTIGVMDTDDSATVVTFTGGESEILKNFFSWLADTLGKTQGGVQYIGHCILFDLRVIAARSVVNDVRQTIRLPHDAKPWSDRIYDTAMYLCDRPVSMDDMCVALGIKGKGDFGGAMVYDAYMRGEIERIAEYCAGDVRRTLEIYQRLER